MSGPVSEHLREYLTSYAPSAPTIEAAWTEFLKDAEDRARRWNSANGFGYTPRTVIALLAEIKALSAKPPSLWLRRKSE